MVQGGNINKNISKKKQKKETQKRKAAPKEQNEETKNRDEVSKTIFRKVKEHQKKIYKSIEQTIIDKAKKSRERFTII